MPIVGETVVRLAAAQGCRWPFSFVLSGHRQKQVMVHEPRSDGPAHGGLTLDKWFPFGLHRGLGIAFDLMFIKCE